ncbi:MAG: hypothetical protein GWP14_08305 [Actinobacteria bacterium]|nr:hypothetical protein [Actinomycetota bacterium]
MTKISEGPITGQLPAYTKKALRSQAQGRNIKARSVAKALRQIGVQQAKQQLQAVI